MLFAGSLNAEHPTANSQRVACVCHHTENGANLHTYSISPNKLDLAMQNANASLSGLLNMDGGGCVWYVSAGAYLFVSFLLSLTPNILICSFVAMYVCISVCMEEGLRLNDAQHV